MSFTGEDAPLAKLMLSVLGAFAKFERILVRELQCEGLIPFFTDPIKSTSIMAPKGNSRIATVTEVVDGSLDLVLVCTKNSINEQRPGCK